LDFLRLIRKIRIKDILKDSLLFILFKIFYEYDKNLEDELQVYKNDKIIFEKKYKIDQK